MHHQFDFTLAELLIAVAILGEIATFTIPKIISSQQNGQRKMVFKETLATISALSAAAGRDGGLTDTTSEKAFFRNNLNYVKLCDTDVYTQGCWAEAAGGNADGYVLPNGASIISINGMLPEETITIDWNGTAPPNLSGNDRLFFTICLRGTCTNSKLPGHIYVAPGGTHETLYKSIFE
jgi:type II secretory pathway pseudopilin PulG